MPHPPSATPPSRSPEPASPDNLHLPWDTLVDRAEQLTRAARSDRTRRAYRSAWRDFQAWCDRYQRSSLPADPVTVAIYLADRSAFLGINTLRLRRVAISMAHRACELPFMADHPSIRDVWAGIRREDPRPPRRAAALLQADLKRMIAALPPTLAGVRDQAILAIGFGAALRRSELATLDCANLDLSDSRLLIGLEHTKTQLWDPEQAVTLTTAPGSALCPVAALTRWFDLAEISDGPVFRPVTRSGQVLSRPLCDRSIARIIQRAAAAAGIPLERISGHSLRAGCLTAASLEGANASDIMRHSRHRSLAGLMPYIRTAERRQGELHARLLQPK